MFFNVLLSPIRRFEASGLLSQLLTLCLAMRTLNRNCSRKFGHELRTGHAFRIVAAIGIITNTWACWNHVSAKCLSFMALRHSGDLSITRRLLLGSATVSSIFGSTKSTAADSVDNTEDTSSDAGDCKCCMQDWCGCTGCLNCQPYLKTLGFEVPNTASQAHKEAGASWSNALRYRETFTGLPGVSSVVSLEQVHVANSSLESAGKGLVADVALPKGAVFPPYNGRVLTFEEGTKGGDYVWCPSSAGVRMYLEEEEVQSSKELSYCIDSSKALDGNPVRFINGAATREQCKAANVELCEFGDVMYARTSNSVFAGAELITDYGDFYWQNGESC